LAGSAVDLPEGVAGAAVAGAGVAGTFFFAAAGCATSTKANKPMKALFARLMAPLQLGNDVGERPTLCDERHKKVIE